MGTPFAFRSCRFTCHLACNQLQCTLPCSAPTELPASTPVKLSSIELSFRDNSIFYILLGSIKLSQTCRRVCGIFEKRLDHFISLNIIQLFNFYPYLNNIPHFNIGYIIETIQYCYNIDNLLQLLLSESTLRNPITISTPRSIFLYNLVYHERSEGY